MSDQKVEGKVKEIADIKASDIGGGFSSGIDTKIATIEDQLQKAQDTLVELQALKERLEEEKKINEEKAEQEKELRSVGQLREENSKLKEELKSYHDEIDSLKDVISSLKDDLSQSAELFQSKVVNSLKKLEEANSALKSGGKVNSKETKSEEDKPKEKTVETEIKSEKEDKAAVIEEKVKEAKPVAKEEPVVAVEKIEPAEETKVETAKNDATPEQAKPEETAAPLEAKEDNFTATDPKEELTVEEDDEIEQKEFKEEAVAEELTEYDRIKKELEDIVHSNIFSHEEEIEKADAAKNALPVAEEKPAETAAKIETKEAKPKKGFFSFLKKDKKAKTDIPAEIKPEVAVETAAPTVSAPVEPVAEVKIEEKPEEKALEEKIEEAKPEIAVPTPAVEVAPEPKVEVKAVEAKVEEKTKKEKKHEPKVKQNGGGKLLMKMAAFVLIACSALIAYKVKNADKLREALTNQVQQAYSQTPQSTVPDEFAAKTPEEKYPTAYANATFDNTTWTTHNDSNLNIQIDYPQNTSYRLKPIDSNNLWFLRKDGYLMKIDKIMTDATMDQFVTDYRTDIRYKVENTVLNKVPCVKLTPLETLPVPGNIYLVKNGDHILRIWYRTYAPGENTEDEKRVEKMISSIQIFSATTDKTKK